MKINETNLEGFQNKAQFLQMLSPKQTLKITDPHHPTPGEAREK